MLEQQYKNRTSSFIATVSFSFIIRTSTHIVLSYILSVLAFLFVCVSSNMHELSYCAVLIFTKAINSVPPHVSVCSKTGVGYFVLDVSCSSSVSHCLE